MSRRGGDLQRDEIPPGTFYLLVLKTPGRSGEMHGYEIASSIQRTSDGVLQVEEGSSALRYDDAHQRLGDCQVGTTAGNRSARYYQLTPAGRKQLTLEMTPCERVIGAITHVIEAV